MQNIIGWILKLTYNRQLDGIYLEDKKVIVQRLLD